MLDGNIRCMGLRSYFAQRHDQEVVRETIRVYEHCMSVGWEASNAFANAVSVAERMDMSPKARAMISEYPPIRQVIDENRESITVRSFLLDPELTFTFPG